MPRINIGTAGWSIPQAAAHHFPCEGTSLERYAARFSVAEINSSFHRRHRISTWERWRDSVPDDFRFSVKVPKTITHQAKLIACDELLDEFLKEASSLSEKLAVLLVQLPPKLQFDVGVATAFFTALKERTPAMIVCEPRNVSWFTARADALLVSLKAGRVAADPALCDIAARPGGWSGISYWRLHGSPVIYRSSYSDRVCDYSRLLQNDPAQSHSWCIFDNTASSAAVGDALALLGALGETGAP